MRYLVKGQVKVIYSFYSGVFGRKLLEEIGIDYEVIV